jgi:integrase
MLDRLPVDDRPPVPITEEALELAIKRAGETMRCWLVLAAYAGCSPQEIAGVTRDDIVTNAHYPYLRIRKGKRGRERLVMLDERVKQAVLGLEELLQSGEPLWIIDPQACSKAINAYLQRECRIEATSSQLRHRFVKVQLEVSQDLLEAQRAIGHALPTSTLAYVPEPNVRLTAKVARHN